MVPCGQGEERLVSVPDQEVRRSAFRLVAWQPRHPHGAPGGRSAPREREGKSGYRELMMVALCQAPDQRPGSRSLRARWLAFGALGNRPGLDSFLSAAGVLP